MNKNNVILTAQDIEVLFGSNIKFNLNSSFSVQGISTDSRTIEKGNLFVALKGENFDGNSKVVESLNKGAAAAIVDSKFYNEHQTLLKTSNIIISEDTLIDLGRIAKYHRLRYEIPVIAVAGSNGKTTTKEMISAVLNKKFNLLKTEGNFNNRIGVPLTLFRLDKTHEAAVIEMGTNEPGEIAMLSDIVFPNAGIITNIGREHLEQLVDLDGVEMEETYLFGHLKKQNAVCYVNYDDPRLRKYAGLLDKAIGYGINKDADITATINFDEELHPILKINYQKENFTVHLKAVGFAASLNATAAIAVGLNMEIPANDIKTALENFEPEKGHGYARMALEEINGITILNDCYNANPDSMRMAVRTLEHINSKGKKYAVLGDMRELGESSQAEHISLLEEISEIFDSILITGEEMIKARNTIKSKTIKTFNNKDELSHFLKSDINRGDMILIKGSRGMEMEKIIGFLNNY